MMPRESLLFKKHDLAALACQDAGNRATRRPATNNDHIVVSVHFHSCLYVTHCLQFGFEEFGKKMIDLQQAASCKRDGLVPALNQLGVVESFVNRLKLVPHIDTELAAEVLQINRPGLELQNHLADKFLLRSQSQRPQQR